LHLFTVVRVCEDEVEGLSQSNMVRLDIPKHIQEISSLLECIFSVIYNHLVSPWD
jgi:hypothetical protein